LTDVRFILQGTAQQANERLAKACTVYQEKIPTIVGIAMAMDEDTVHEISMFGDSAAYKAHIKESELYSNWQAAFDEDAVVVKGQEGHVLLGEADQDMIDGPMAGWVYSWEHGSASELGEKTQGNLWLGGT